MAKGKAGWPEEVKARAISLDAMPRPIPTKPLDGEICRVLRPYVSKPKRLNVKEANELRVKLWFCWLGYQTPACVRFLEEDGYFSHQEGHCAVTRRLTYFAVHLGDIIGSICRSERMSITAFEKMLRKRSATLVKDRKMQRDIIACHEIPAVAPTPSVLVPSHEVIPASIIHQADEVLGEAESGDGEDMYVEEALDRLYAKAAEAEIGEAAALTGLLAGIIPGTRVPFRPPIPAAAKDGQTHEQLLVFLRDRLVYHAYDGGKGLGMPKSDIKMAAETFCRREFTEKTLEQLQAIERIPRTPINLEFLHTTGLLKRPFTTERCGIYYKQVPVPHTGIQDMANSSHRSTSLIGKEILDHTINSVEQVVHVFSVGRLSGGLKKRVTCEESEQRAKSKCPEKTLRPWIEAVFHSGTGAGGIEYWLLTDLSGLIGGERTTRLVFDEIFFTIIFTNPCNSAAAWPGGMPPPPPSSIAETNPLLAELNEVMTRSDYSLFQVALDRGLVGDRLTWSALRKSGYNPLIQTPIEYLQGFKPATVDDALHGGGARRTIFCHGLDIPFTAPVGTKKGTVFEVWIRPYFTKLVPRTDGIPRPNGISRPNDAPTIWVRPGGTDILGAYMFGPLSLLFVFTSRGKNGQSAKYLDYVGDDMLVQLAVGVVPGSRHDHDRPIYGIYIHGSTPRQWLEDITLTPVTLKFPPEAMDLLKDQTPTPTRIQDLDIIHSLRNGERYRSTGRERAKKHKRVGAPATTTLLPPPPDDVTEEWKDLRARIARAEMDLLEISAPIEDSSTITLNLEKRGFPDAVREMKGQHQEARKFAEKYGSVYNLGSLEGWEAFIE